MRNEAKYEYKINMNQNHLSNINFIKVILKYQMAELCTLIYTIIKKVNTTYSVICVLYNDYLIIDLCMLQHACRAPKKEVRKIERWMICTKLMLQ